MDLISIVENVINHPRTETYPNDLHSHYDKRIISLYHTCHCVFKADTQTHKYLCNDGQPVEDILQKYGYTKL